jgi:ssDNA-specific exonuclease RecJ
MTIKELIQAELERVPDDQLEQVYNLLKAFNQKVNHEDASDWETLEDLLEECKVETGISDLSEQHDHYLHGTPKREEV